MVVVKHSQSMGKWLLKIVLVNILDQVSIERIIFGDYIIFATEYFYKNKEHTSFSWLFLSVPKDLEKVPNKSRVLTFQSRIIEESDSSLPPNKLLPPETSENQAQSLKLFSAKLKSIKFTTSQDLFY